MLRGRQGRAGFRNMSLSTFLDVVWADLWDDVSPMGDRARYHQIIVELFIEGKDPYDIAWKDHDGKTQRLSDQRTGDGKPPKSAIDQAKEWREMMRRVEKPDLVESKADGSGE